jgi:hypothetical protein
MSLAFCMAFHTYIQKYEEAPLTEHIPVDADVLELRLPEDRKIQVKTAEDLQAIARKVGKPILHEVVDGRLQPLGSRLPRKASHLLAVYDGPWVYYCELQAEEEGREGHAP